MKLTHRLFLAFSLLAISFAARAQVIVEDTARQQAFFKSRKFTSNCYVGFEAQPGQILTKKAAMLVGFNLNWVVNHKYVVSAKYHTLTTQNDVRELVEPGSLAKISLIHHYAGLGFSYILFHDKRFSFQPELSAGWASAKFNYAGADRRHDYGAIIPAVYGIWNATKLFRVGVGLNYRAVIGSKFYGINSMQLGGVSGVVFMRVGTF